MIHVCLPSFTVAVYACNEIWQTPNKRACKTTILFVAQRSKSICRVARMNAYAVFPKENNLSVYSGKWKNTTIRVLLVRHCVSTSNRVLLETKLTARKRVLFVNKEHRREFCALSRIFVSKNKVHSSEILVTVIEHEYWSLFSETTIHSWNQFIWLVSVFFTYCYQRSSSRTLALRARDRISELMITMREKDRYQWNN